MMWWRFLCFWLTFSVALIEAYPIGSEDLQPKDPAEILKQVYELALQQKWEKQWDQEQRSDKESDFLKNSDEVASVMGINAGKPKGGPSLCLENGTSSTPTITYEDLKEVINTVEIVFGQQTTLKSYIAVDYGSTIYSEFEPLISLFLLFSQFDNPANQNSLPDTLWMSRSPCPGCAKRIMADYNKHSIKPTIHVASFFTGNNLEQTVESLKCLAKLKFLNYTVLPWDWNEFRDNLHNEDCKNAIGIAQENEDFLKKQSELLKILQFAEDLTQMPEDVLETWCSLD